LSKSKPISNPNLLERGRTIKKGLALASFAPLLTTGFVDMISGA